MSIKTLPPEIANQIAAGEVVERPASVVKECVENAIDAGATLIEIHIENGGKKCIKIIDNGIGMSPTDLELSIQRHATSKIQNIEDLFSIQSFGFRGEALAAISAVSDFEIVSKTSEQEFGSKVELKSGKNKKISTVAANNGTQILIKDLFVSTPARKQYLKTDETEYREIVKEIKAFSLAHYQIGFRLFKNGKNVLDYSATSNVKQRIIQIFKRNSDQMIPINFEPINNGLSSETLKTQQLATNTTLTISGFISRPEACVANRNQQYLFVNGRKINDYKLAYAVREAYNRSCGIEKHLHPQFVIFIEIDPILVDVNVHPRKLEVKFSEPREVFSTLSRVIGSALLKASQNPDKTISNERVLNKTPQSFKKLSRESFSSIPRPQFNIPRNKVLTGNLFNQNILEKANTNAPSSTFNTQHSKIEKKTITADNTLGNLILIGQIARKYIIAEGETGMFIFDQHALHERQRFEHFWKKIHGQKIRTQKLLINQDINLSEEEVSILHENKNILQDMGFSFTFSHDDTISINEIPNFLESENLEQYFRNFVEYFEHEQIGEHSVDRFLRRIIEYKACRGAVMFGDRLETEEMQKILDDLKDTQFKWLCAHGRPNYWFVPFDELDRKFHR